MELLRDYWALLVGGVAALVWLVRLEARTFANEEGLKRQREQRHEDMAAAVTSRQQIDNRLDEIQRDIKVLLRQGAQP